MLYDLVLKDFLLAKKYLLYIVLAVIGLPVFLYLKVGYTLGGFVCFFIGTIYILFILFGTVSMMEEKYKGASLLCATPYSRNLLVKSKYLFLLTLFVLCFIVYTAEALIVPINMNLLSIYEFGMSLLLITAFFGVLIPLQYKVGYEKVKYISFFFIFLLPFIIATVAKALGGNSIDFSFSFSLPPVISGFLPLAASVLIGFISVKVSVSIYSKKNL